MTVAIGIDIGGTGSKVGVVDAEGEILHRLTFPTEEHLGGEQLLAKMLRAAQECLTSGVAEREDFVGIGIGSPGIIDPERGIVSDCPGKIPGWTGTHVTKQLSEAVGLPAWMDNDVKVIGLGEGWLGAGKDARHFLVFALGTGIGGAVIIDGKVYQGAHYNAGILGHIIVDPAGYECICGNRGCIEAYASSRSVAARAVDHILRGVQTSIKDLVAGDLNKVDARAVAEAAEAGDRIAQDVLREAAHHLATAIISAVHILDPELIVIGGGVARAEKYFIEEVRDLVQEYAWLPPGATVDVVAARLGDDAGILGGAKLAFDRSATL